MITSFNLVVKSYQQKDMKNGGSQAKRGMGRKRLTSLPNKRSFFFQEEKTTHLSLSFVLCFILTRHFNYVCRRCKWNCTFFHANIISFPSSLSSWWEFIYPSWSTRCEWRTKEFVAMTSHRHTRFLDHHSKSPPPLLSSPSSWLMLIETQTVNGFLTYVDSIGRKESFIAAKMLLYSHVDNNQRNWRCRRVGSNGTDILNIWDDINRFYRKSVGP